MQTTSQDKPEVFRSTRRLAHTIPALVVALLGLATCCFTIYIQVSLATLAPFFDHWGFYINLARDPGLSYFRHLFTHANGHWLAMPKLLFLADFYLAGGRNTLLFFVIVLCQLVNVLVFVLIWRRDRRGCPPSLLALAGCSLCFHFAPNQIANFVWSYQVTLVLAGVAASASCYALARLVEAYDAGAPAAKQLLWFAAVATASSVAAMSFATGLMVLPALIVASFIAGFRNRWTLALIALLAVILTGYALTAPHDTTPVHQSFSWWPMVQYFFAYLGSVYGGAKVTYAMITGSIGFCLAVTVLLTQIRATSRDRIDVFATAELLYLLAAALATAYGRYHFGVQQALESRYLTFVNAIWLTLLLWFGARVLPQLRVKQVNANLALCAGGLLILIVSLSAWRKARTDYYARADGIRLAESALQSNVYDRSTIYYSALDPEVVHSAFVFLRERRQSFFGSPYYFPLGTAYEERFSLVSGARCGGRIDHIQLVRDPGQSGLSITGRASGRGQEAFSRLIVVNDKGQIAGYGTQLRLNSPVDKGRLVPALHPHVWRAYAALDQTTDHLQIYGVLDSRNRVCEVATVANDVAREDTYSGPVSKALGLLDRGKLGVLGEGHWYEQVQGDSLWDRQRANDYPNFWVAASQPVCSDWNRQGRLQMGLFKDGTWWVDRNGNGQWDPATDEIFRFGKPGDIAVAGDWDGTGWLRIGVFRAGRWLLDMNGDHKWDPRRDKTLWFGEPGDIPVVGDWDGSGRLHIGVFRRGQWLLDKDGDGRWDPRFDEVAQFGEAGDIPVIGNWDGVGKLRIGTYNKGFWRLDMNGNHAWDGVNVDRFYPFVYATPKSRPVSPCW